MNDDHRYCIYCTQVLTASEILYKGWPGLVIHLSQKYVTDLFEQVGLLCALVLSMHHVAMLFNICRVSRDLLVVQLE